MIKGSPIFWPQDIRAILGRVPSPGKKTKLNSFSLMLKFKKKKPTGNWSVCIIRIGRTSMSYLHKEVFTAFYLNDLRANKAMWNVSTLLGLIRYAYWWDNKKWQKLKSNLVPPFQKLVRKLCFTCVFISSNIKSIKI